jgi:hypothetical protein
MHEEVNMNNSMAAWTDADVLRSFFWFFEWASGRPPQPGSHDHIIEMMRAELSRNDPTVGELIGYVVEQTTVILTTPKREQHKLADQAREIVAQLFADTSNTGRGRILRALAQAVKPHTRRGRAGCTARAVHRGGSDKRLGRSPARFSRRATGARIGT